MQTFPPRVCIVSLKLFEETNIDTITHGKRSDVYYVTYQNASQNECERPTVSILGVRFFLFSFEWENLQYGLRNCRMVRMTFENNS